jgi:hypothetical protein
VGAWCIERHLLVARTHMYTLQTTHPSTEQFLPLFGLSLAHNPTIALDCIASTRAFLVLATPPETRRPFPIVYLVDTRLHRRNASRIRVRYLTTFASCPKEDPLEYDAEDTRTHSLTLISRT